VTTDVATTLELHDDDEDDDDEDRLEAVLAPFSFLSNCADSGLDEEAPLCVPTRYLYPPIILRMVNLFISFICIYYISETKEKQNTNGDVWVLRAMRKNVFCVFEGTRKSTKKKAAGWREEEGGHFSQKQGKEHQKLIKKQLFSLTHSLISFFSRRGVVRFIIFFIKREKTYVIHTHTHTHTHTRFENTKRISLENHSD